MDAEAFQEMDLQGTDSSQNSENLASSENFEYCPECETKNILSKVERLQCEEDRYWVVCTRMGNGCCYLQDFQGKVKVTKEELIVYGIPGQLLDHMDIYPEDINKIVRFCISEYFRAKNVPLLDLEKINYITKQKTENLGVKISNHPDLIDRTSGEQMNAASIISLDQPGGSDGSFEGNSGTILAHPSSDYSQNSQSKKLEKQESTEAEKMLFALPGFSDSDEFGQLQTATYDQPHGVEEDLTHLFQTLDVDPFQKPIDDTCEETKVPSKSRKRKSRKQESLQHSSSDKINDFVRKFSDSLVADLSTTYQENLKKAFAKIEGYNFPYDFVDNLDDLPLHKILEEREKEEQSKPGMSERSKNFLSEMDSMFLPKN